MDRNNTKFVQLTVFLTSFTILAYEIILTRIFSITQWQNLSSIIISVALLGFGASGTVIFLLRKHIKKHFKSYIFTALFLYPFFLCLGFILYCKIQFNPFAIGIDNKQIINLLLHFLVIGIPFFFGASIIGITFIKFSVSKTYFYNLAGSGIGALFIVVISYLFHPYTILLIISSLSFLTVIIFSFNLKKTISYISLIIIFLLVTGFYLSFDYLNLKKISQYKSISRALTLPEAKIENEEFSPLGLVQVVGAKGLRATVGLSLLAEYHIPVQKGIFFDGSGISPITPYKKNKKQIEYLNYIPSILPYFLLEEREKEKILIVGTGGGEGILKALLHNFKDIDGLEINKNVISLMRNKYAKFSGNIYNLSRVNIINKEARDYIQTTEKKYDLIEISMTDAFNTAASGIYSLNETYLYTVESIQKFYQHLTNNGLLAITRWVLSPPRDNIKMVNICIQALKDLHINNINQHIIFIRTIQAATIIISKSPVTSKKINIAKKFCRLRLFDLVYYNGIKKAEVNRYIKIKTPFFYDATKKLLSNKSTEFIKKYNFNISASTDNRPYFYNYFKSKMIKYIVKYGVDKIPFTEWGAFILVILLIPVLIISFLLIIIPLVFLKSKINFSKWLFFLYFGLIGMGFFFIEMPLIQKLILFLSHPTYSLSVIISTLLIFSGIGSYFSNRIFPADKRILYSSLIIVLLTILYTLNFNNIFTFFMNSSKLIKILITIILLLPLAFFMGIPFPQALQKLKRMDPNMVPWAWGINGFFSVISTILATLLAIFWGFKIVFLFACLFYLAAGIIAYKRI